MAHKKHHHPNPEFSAIEYELKELQARINKLQKEGVNVDQLLSIIAKMKSDFLAKVPGDISPAAIATLSAALLDLNSVINPAVTPPAGNPPAAPTISSLSVTSGPVGTPFTVSGTGFGTTKGSASLTVGGISAVLTGGTDTSLDASVPDGVALGAVAVIVTTAGGTSSSSPFTVTA